MTVDSKGHGLFIVDNSVSGWTGLRYLEEWSSIAKAFDIATGYFEIGALLTLDGKWQGLDKVRILMGAETTHRTRKVILGAVRAQALDRLDESIEEDKEPNPFLHGVPAILDALRSGQIECRVYGKDKFHAKAYITHAKLEVVGSSNFTRPGSHEEHRAERTDPERPRGRATHRRMNPEIEKRLVAGHPEAAVSRGKVWPRCVRVSHIEPHRSVMEL